MTTRVETIVGAAVLGAMLGLAGCGGNGSDSGGAASSGGGSVTYSGTVNGAGGVSGTLSVTISGSAAATRVLSPSAPVPSASATLLLVGGNTVPLSGSFISPSGPLMLSGGGYNFTGIVSGDILGGTFSGPLGSGTFAMLVSASDGSVTLYCGSFTGTSSGTWNLAVSGPEIVGSFADTVGDTGEIIGTLTGSSVSANLPGGSATGTMSPSSAGGTWTAGTNGFGVWRADATACN